MRIPPMGQVNIDVLIRQLDHPEFALRDEAKRALLRLGDSAIDPLIEVLTTGSGRQQWEAAELLSRLRDSRAFLPLAQTALSRNPVLGQLAVRALEEYGPVAIGTLIELLPHAVVMAQLQIVSALQNLGSPSAIDPLLNMMAATSSATLRYRIIGAIGALGDAGHVARLAPYTDDDDPYVRQRASEIMAALGLTSRAVVAAAEV